MDLEELFLRFIGQYHEVLREADREEIGMTNVPDITIRQFFYLEEIQHQKETTLTAVAQALSVSKPTATAAISKLVRDGYIIRTQSAEDQRKYILSLSEQGEQVFERKQEAYLKFIRQVRAGTSIEEQAILREAFEIMSACSQHARPEGKNMS